MQTIVERQGKDKKLSSTIRVNPTIQWPKLGDDGPDCREVAEFFEAFEETVGLANDGAGMTDKGRLKVLSACLKGSRQKTYENLIKKHRAIGEVENDPGKAFDIEGQAHALLRNTDGEADEGALRMGRLVER